MLFGGRGDPGRAGDPGAAEAAIAERVLCQVLLVVILGEIKGWRGADLGRDRAVAGLAEPRLVHLAPGLGGLALARRIGIDRRAVLRADIVALAHPLGRVVPLPAAPDQ